ncbi:aspartyl aminopeptidase [Helicocarpus griseus UAMH5409]|uniref:aspartyl aminopeptidase n=1 Tax=Helicocarpus griseus UAMH5409 TaxID=1447875 RepID=A0A2B7Y275_9EURO|nr:aspartyl aminopeptidase [Helicocarpus griseus UAMH5409]
MTSKLWGEPLSTARQSIRSLGRVTAAPSTSHIAHKNSSVHPHSNSQQSLNQWQKVNYSRRLFTTSSLSFSSTSSAMTEINFKAQAKDFLSFVNASPTPFHAVASASKRLVDAGFQEVKEKDSWTSICKPGGKYYVTRNGSTVIAFAIGRKWNPGNSISMVGAHTDSPCLRIKPVSKKSGEGFVQVGVETYGGGIWHTWFDRDLGIAGRAMVRNEDGSIEAKLVHIDRPILRIPTLAIHLDRQETFTFNKETQLFPIAGLVAAELARKDGDPKSKKELEIRAKEKDNSSNGNGTNGNQDDEDVPFAPLKAATERHHPYLVELIASELSISPQDIIDFEMLLYDTQKASLGGMLDEFIFSARLDNLNMSFCATMGLINSVQDPSSLDNESSIRLIALFDHEEIGSRTAQGADSNALPAILRRLSVLPSSGKSKTDTSTAYEQSLSTSFLLSADMAHSINPNYSFKYESDHKPEMNKGPVIKINANARYATNSPGIVLLQESARLAAADANAEDEFQGVPLQLFVVRNDSSCGSTIGPMLSAALGVRTLDLGNAQLSMHSIRETGGTDDVGYAVKLFESFFENYSKLSKTIFVD